MSFCRTSTTRTAYCSKWAKAGEKFSCKMNNRMEGLKNVNLTQTVFLHTIHLSHLLSGTY
jgi:hypothetical protein